MHILMELLVRNRRLVGRMYGYGCALICLLETSSDPPAPRGWPLGLALLAITAVATDHDGVRARWRLLHTRPGRVHFYAVLGLIVTLTAMAVPPRSTNPDGGIVGGGQASACAVTQWATVWWTTPSGRALRRRLIPSAYSPRACWRVAAA